MESPIEQLRQRVFKGEPGSKATELSGIIDLARNLGCLGEIVGREFEVRTPDGKLVFLVKQKPLKIPQVEMLMKELSVLKEIDAEIEAKKFGTKKGRRRH